MNTTTHPWVEQWQAALSSVPNPNASDGGMALGSWAIRFVSVMLSTPSRALLLQHSETVPPLPAAVWWSVWQHTPAHLLHGWWGMKNQLHHFSSLLGTPSQDWPIWSPQITESGEGFIRHAAAGLMGTWWSIFSDAVPVCSAVMSSPPPPRRGWTALPMPVSTTASLHCPPPVPDYMLLWRVVLNKHRSALPQETQKRLCEIIWPSISKPDCPEAIAHAIELGLFDWALEAIGRDIPKPGDTAWLTWLSAHTSSRSPPTASGDRLFQFIISNISPSDCCEEALPMVVQKASHQHLFPDVWSKYNRAHDKHRRLFSLASRSQNVEIASTVAQSMQAADHTPITTLNFMTHHSASEVMPLAFHSIPLDMLSAVVLDILQKADRINITHSMWGAIPRVLHLLTKDHLNALSKALSPSVPAIVAQHIVAHSTHHNLLECVRNPCLSSEKKM